VTIAYANETQVRRIFNTYGITAGIDDDRDESADTGLMAQMLSDADAEAESYVVTKYPSLALSAATGTTVPEVLEVQASKLAAANALARQGKLSFLRDQAITWFEKLQEGIVILVGVTESGLADSTTHEKVMTFGQRQLDDYGEGGLSDMSTGTENDYEDA
jgi:phage gp36-like protein